MRQSRTSAEARWVASPSRRSSAGESRPIASRVGAGSAQVRITARSIARARRASISWPQIARSTAWATVGSRSGRSPASSRTDRPSSGSERKRRANSEVSSSSASMKRSSEIPASSGARSVIVPSRRCHANPLPPPGSALSKTSRRELSRNEYGPTGLTTASITGSDLTVVP